MQKINGTEESMLVELIRSGHHESFRDLFNFYYPGLVLYATQLTTNKTQSEEIVQDFFVRFWERHHMLKPANSLKNYLFTSVRNSCFNYLRHQKIKAEYINELEQLSLDHLLYDPDLYVVSELQETIIRAIEALPERCREVFVMSRFKGKRNEEIAADLQISVRTVETQISKALKTLRVQLKDYIGLLLLFGIKL
jgi:RNA polymerase sigma-70 factor (ECF subfamily)